MTRIETREKAPSVNRPIQISNTGSKLLAFCTKIDSPAQVGFLLYRGSTNAAGLVYCVFAQDGLISSGATEQIRFRVASTLGSHGADCVLHGAEEGFLFRFG
jgi:hypothetical protein